MTWTDNAMPEKPFPSLLSLATAARNYKMTHKEENDVFGSPPQLVRFIASVLWETLGRKTQARSSDPTFTQGSETRDQADTSNQKSM